MATVATCKRVFILSVMHEGVLYVACIIIIIINVIICSGLVYFLEVRSGQEREEG